MLVIEDFCFFFSSSLARFWACRCFLDELVVVVMFAVPASRVTAAEIREAVGGNAGVDTFPGICFPCCRLLTGCCLSLQDAWVGVEAVDEEAPELVVVEVAA